MLRAAETACQRHVERGPYYAYAFMWKNPPDRRTSALGPTRTKRGRRATTRLSLPPRRNKCILDKGLVPTRCPVLRQPDGLEELVDLVRRDALLLDQIILDRK